MRLGGLCAFELRLTIPREELNVLGLGWHRRADYRIRHGHAILQTRAAERSVKDAQPLLASGCDRRLGQRFSLRPLEVLLDLRLLTVRRELAERGVDLWVERVLVERRHVVILGA